MLPTYHPLFPPPCKQLRTNVSILEILVLLPTLATPLAEMTITVTLGVCTAQGPRSCKVQTACNQVND